MNVCLKSLVQNMGFKVLNGKLPTVNQVYPDYTSDGLTEEWRYSPILERELAERKNVVLSGLFGMDVIYTTNKSILLDVDAISPRLRLREQILGEVNSVFSYAPLLFVGVNGEDFIAFLVKPIVDGSMAWFELTPNESNATQNLLKQYATAQPYRSRWQRLREYCTGKKVAA